MAKNSYSNGNILTKCAIWYISTSFYAKEKCSYTTATILSPPIGLNIIK